MCPWQYTDVKAIGTSSCEGSPQDRNREAEHAAMDATIQLVAHLCHLHRTHTASSWCCRLLYKASDHKKQAVGQLELEVEGYLIKPDHNKAHDAWHCVSLLCPETPTGTSAHCGVDTPRACPQDCPEFPQRRLPWPATNSRDCVVDSVVHPANIHAAID